MLEIVIRLEEDERVFNAFNADSSEDVKEELMNYLNSRVNDYEQNIEVQKVVEAYEFTPLIEVQEEVEE